NAMTTGALLARLDYKVTALGFRSTFRDWAAERTTYPNHAVRMALAELDRGSRRRIGAATCSTDGARWRRRGRGTAGTGSCHDRHVVGRRSEAAAAGIAGFARWVS